MEKNSLLLTAYQVHSYLLKETTFGWFLVLVSLEITIKSLNNMLYSYYFSYITLTFYHERLEFSLFASLSHSPKI